jgi:hypothetical protein
MAYYTPWFFIFLGRKVECPAFYLPFLYSAFDTHGRLSDRQFTVPVSGYPSVRYHPPQKTQRQIRNTSKSILVHSCCAVLQGISKTRSGNKGICFESNGADKQKRQYLTAFAQPCFSADVPADAAMSISGYSHGIMPAEPK